MAELTVRDLLPTRFKRLDEVVEAEVQRDNALHTAGFPKALTGVVAERAASTVGGVLNIDVFELMAGAWAKARELHEYSTAAGKHPPEETSTLFLGEHELAAQLHPLADVTFGAVSHIRLKFTLRLAARVQEAQLTIRNGHIIKIGRCDGSVSAQLKYGEIPLHDKLTSKALPLIPSAPLPGSGVVIL